MVHADVRFQLRPQGKPFQIVIVHSSGNAWIKSSAQWDRARMIRLQPWARFERTFRVGTEPTADVPIEINTHTATVDRDGTFRIDDVPPGNYLLNVGFDRESAGQRVGVPLDVPADNAEANTKPVDLGTLKLNRP
jgi:hypothetical protein